MGGLHRSPQSQASGAGTLPPTRPSEPALTQAPPPAAHWLPHKQLWLLAPASRSVPASSGCALVPRPGAECPVPAGAAQRTLGGPAPPKPTCRRTLKVHRCVHTQLTQKQHAQCTYAACPCTQRTPMCTHAHTHTKHMCASLQAKHTLHEHVPRTCKSRHGFERVPLVAGQHCHREKLALLAMLPAASGTAGGPRDVGAPRSWKRPWSLWEGRCSARLRRHRGPFAPAAEEMSTPLPLHPVPSPPSPHRLLCPPPRCCLCASTPGSQPQGLLTRSHQEPSFKISHETPASQSPKALTFYQK